MGSSIPIEDCRPRFLVVEVERWKCPIFEQMERRRSKPRRQRRRLHHDGVDATDREGEGVGRVCGGKSDECRRRGELDEDVSLVVGCSFDRRLGDPSEEVLSTRLRLGDDAEPRNVVAQVTGRMEVNLALRVPAPVLCVSDTGFNDCSIRLTGAWPCPPHPHRE